MNAYKLDNPQVDASFLKGEVVPCQVAFKANDNLLQEMTEGLKIVVLLSNGKKYMGRITRFEYSVIDQYASGTIEVVRHPDVGAKR